MLVLSVDLEEWFHLIGQADDPGPSGWAALESRVDEPLDWLLAALAERNRKATFFCLGWLAGQRPDLIRRIAGMGHEIACHSHLHRPLSALNPESFESDLVRALGLLRDLSGQPVSAYRAPGFSLGPAQAWAFDILLRHGVETDSSITAGYHPHGGFAGFPATGPVRIATAGGLLNELPLSLTRVLGLRVCVTGGGFFRLAPWPLIARSLRGGGYAMSYLHPRDLDPGTPLPRGAGPARRFRMRVGLGGARAKLLRLLDTVPTASVAETVAATDWAAVPLVRPHHIASEGALERKAA